MNKVLMKSNVSLFYSFLVGGGGVFGLFVFVVSLFRNTNGYSRYVMWQKYQQKHTTTKTFQASRSTDTKLISSSSL